MRITQSIAPLPPKAPKPRVRSYSEWIHQTNALTDQELWAKKPLEDLRRLLVHQWETLLKTFSKEKKVVERYKNTIPASDDSVEFDASIFSRLEKAIQQRVQQLHKLHLDTKDKWTIFVKKFHQLEQHQKWYLDMVQRVHQEIQQPVSRLRYQLALYQGMGMEQERVKQRVKRL